jgi:DNA-binding phage protein
MAPSRNTYVTANLEPMSTSPTGAERYLAQRLEDADYRREYEQARERIAQIDAVIRVLDERRSELELSKAELARRAGVKPEAIRRLFSAERPNPTLSTLVALASALDLELRPEPRTPAPTVTTEQSSGGGTRRRTA